MKPPKTFSKEAAGLWKRILDEYQIQDQAGLLILRTALEAFDRMREAQEIIAREGAQVMDRFQQWKAHPLLTVEKDSRAALLQALKSLNLDLEPLGQPGRPAGR